MKNANRFKPRLTCVLLACGLAVFVVGAKQADKPAVDSDAYKAFMSTQVADIYDLEQFFVEQQDSFLPIIPPDPDFILQQTATVPVLPFSFKDFPSVFVKNLVKEYENSVPVYPVTIVEDPFTRETLFLNADDNVVYALPPVTGYDPYAYLKWLMPSLYSGAYSPDEVYFWQKFYDPSRVQISVNLLPVEYVEPFLYVAARIQEEQASLAELSEEGGVMLLRSQEAESNIVIEAFTLQTNGLGVTIGYPDDFTNRLEVFVCTNLLDFWWHLAATNLSTEGTNEITWLDTGGGEGSSEFTAYSYAVGNADADGDNDYLKDAREFFMFHTSMMDPDTDDDGSLDGLDPQPTNSAVARLYLNITSPADGAVLGGYE